jgi:hypothetical protein
MSTSTLAKPKVRKTPTLMELQDLYGPIERYDQRFLRETGEQDRAHATLKKLVDAAEVLISDPLVGLNRFSTAMVSELAGMSVGTFYRYFEDDVALLDYIWPERVTVRPA